MATVGIKPMAFGWRVFGLGIMALGVVNLAWGDFDSGQPVPRWFPAHAEIAAAAALFLLAAGAAIEWRKTAAWAAAALAAYYALVVVVLEHGRILLAHPASFGSYSNPCYQLAVAAGALIVFARNADIDAVQAARLARIGRIAFGLCAVMFGLAHFVYMNFTAPLVPAWLPPSQEFWGYATGAAHIAGGIAIITGVQARLAAILLTVMYASFTPLVHIPQLFAGHVTHFTWSENALNIVLTGAAWIVADSLAVRRSASSPGTAG